METDQFPASEKKKSLTNQICWKGHVFDQKDVTYQYIVPSKTTVNNYVSVLKILQQIKKSHEMVGN